MANPPCFSNAPHAHDTSPAFGPEDDCFGPKITWAPGLDVGPQTSNGRLRKPEDPGKTVSRKFEISSSFIQT